MALEKRYKDEFLKVPPAKVVARFFQVETRLNNLINLKLSSQGCELRCPAETVQELRLPQDGSLTE